jgi:hypothetical protein
MKLELNFYSRPIFLKFNLYYNVENASEDQPISSKQPSSFGLKSSLTKKELEAKSQTQWMFKPYVKREPFPPLKMISGLSKDDNDPPQAIGWGRKSTKASVAAPTKASIQKAASNQVGTKFTLMH